MRRNKDVVSCSHCGSQFVPARIVEGPRYCSKSCVWAATKGPEFNARIAKESAAKRGDIQRGVGDGKSYRKLNGRHEHRVIAETVIGRPLEPGEVVHHKDGNKLNNSPDNLQVMLQGNHMQEHGIGIPGVRPWWEPWKGRKNA